MIVQALQRPRRRLGKSAPAVHCPVAAELLGEIGGVGPSTLAHKVQNARGELVRYPICRSRPSGATADMSRAA